MFARLDRKEIDPHFTYALTIVQANVYVRDLIEKAFSEQLRRDGVTLRRSGPSAHPAATDQIVEPRDQGLNWAEVAEHVGMTRSGAWSRYRRAHRPASPRLGRWQQVLTDALHQTSRLVSERPSLIISDERLLGLSSTPHDEPPIVSPPSVVPRCCTCRAAKATTMRATEPIWCWRSLL